MTACRQKIYIRILYFEAIGRKAVEVLLSEIEGNLTEPVHEEVGVELVIRGSSMGSR